MRPVTRPAPYPSVGIFGYDGDQLKKIWLTSKWKGGSFDPCILSRRATGWAHYAVVREGRIRTGSNKHVAGTDGGSETEADFAYCNQKADGCVQIFATVQNMLGIRP